MTAEIWPPGSFWGDGCVLRRECLYNLLAIGAANLSRAALHDDEDLVGLQDDLRLSGSQSTSNHFALPIFHSLYSLADFPCDGLLRAARIIR